MEDGGWRMDGRDAMTRHKKTRSSKLHFDIPKILLLQCFGPFHRALEQSGGEYFYPQGSCHHENLYSLPHPPLITKPPYPRNPPPTHHLFYSPTTHNPHPSNPTPTPKTACPHAFPLPSFPSFPSFLSVTQTHASTKDVTTPHMNNVPTAFG